MLIKKVYLPFLVTVCVGSFLVFLLAEQAVFLLMGVNDPSVVMLLRLLVFVPVIVCLNIPSYQLLQAYDLRKIYSKIFLYGAFFHVVVNVVFTSLYFAVGTSISIIITEIVITTALVLAHEKFGGHPSVLRRSV